MTFLVRKVSRLEQTANYQVEQLLKRAASAEIAGHARAAKMHHLEAVAWQALMGRSGSREAGASCRR